MPLSPPPPYDPIIARGRYNLAELSPLPSLFQQVIFPLLLLIPIIAWMYYRDDRLSEQRIVLGCGFAVAIGILIRAGWLRFNWEPMARATDAKTQASQTDLEFRLDDSGVHVHIVTVAGVITDIAYTRAQIRGILVKPHTIRFHGLQQAYELPARFFAQPADFAAAAAWFQSSAPVPTTAQPVQLDAAALATQLSQMTVRASGRLTWRAVTRLVPPSIGRRSSWTTWLYILLPLLPGAHQILFKNVRSGVALVVLSVLLMLLRRPLARLWWTFSAGGLRKENRAVSFGAPGLLLQASLGAVLLPWGILRRAWINPHGIIIESGANEHIPILRTHFQNDDDWQRAAHLVHLHLGECPHCQYPRRGTKADLCPECGRNWNPLPRTSAPLITAALSPPA